MEQGLLIPNVAGGFIVQSPMCFLLIHLISVILIMNAWTLSLGITLTFLADLSESWNFRTLTTSIRLSNNIHRHRTFSGPAELERWKE